MEEEFKELYTAELNRVLQGTFLLSDKDIKKYIEKILNEKDENVVDNLTSFIVKFEKYSKNEKYDVERAKAAREVLNRCIKMYLENKERIKDNFFTAMDFAKRQNVNPLKIATMENIRKLTASIYLRTYETLTKIEYKNPITGKTFRLFNDEEFKVMIENCASVICHISEDNVKDIVSILTIFSYDTDTQTFYADGAQMLRDCGTLASYPSTKLSSNIEFLKKHFIPPMTNVELIKRISLSPSLLMCDQNKIRKFEKAIYVNLCELRKENPALFPDGAEFEAFARKYAHDATFNIEKISSITGLTNDNLELEKFSQTKNVLVKYLGAKNALETFTDFNVLSLDPNILDGLLAKLTEYDVKNHKQLRKFFVEHTARALNMIKEGEYPDSQRTKMTGRTVTPRRVRADIQSMPSQVDISERYYTSSDARTINNLFENVQKTSEARKVRKVVDGVEQLSEEEQEELDYMKDVFNRLQRNFDSSQCDSYFEELLTRTQLIIDAKEGKGYAERTFEISRVKQAYRTYAAVCKESKTLSSTFFKLLKQSRELLEEAKKIISSDYIHYRKFCEKHIAFINEFSYHIPMVDKKYKLVEKKVVYELQSVFNKIGMQRDEDYDSGWFDPKELDKAPILLAGLSVAECLNSYYAYMMKTVEKIVPDVNSNYEYVKAKYKFMSNSIELKELMYASKMRSAIYRVTNEIYDEVVKPLELSDMLISEEDKKVNLNTILDISKNMSNIAFPTSMSEIMYKKAHPTILTQINNSRSIKEQVHYLFGKVNKSVDKMPRRLRDISDGMTDIAHTDAGLLLYNDDTIGELTVFISEPKVADYVKEIESLGVKPATASDFEKAYIRNYTFTSTYFSGTDKKSMKPVQYKKKEGK